MKDTSEVSLTEKFMAAFVSPNGNGKTVGYGSFYEKFPEKHIVVHDWDGRMNPIKLVYPKARILYETYGPENFLQFLVDYPRVLADPNVDMYVLDSFTSLSMSAVVFQMNAKGAGTGKVTKGGLVVPTWDEVNGETALLATLLDRCKSSKKHIIFTFHPVSKTEGMGENSKKIKSIAAYGHKIPSVALNYFNEIYTFGTENPIVVGGPVKRIVTTVPMSVMGEEFLGKTALPLPTSMDITKDGLYQTMKRELALKGIEF